MTYDRYMLAEYRITQTEHGYTPQHKTALGWQAIKEPQPTIQQARNVIDIHMRNNADAELFARRDACGYSHSPISISSPLTHT